MKKYFSSVICGNGYLSAYNTIYKRDTDCKVYVIRDGDDVEKAVFFERLIKNLRGYNITIFNPFYDESANGIYIENLNTYILSNENYNRITPVLPEIWEKSVSIADNKTYPKDLICEVLSGKIKENNHYKNACKTLHQASMVKEKIHNSLSPYLDEEKIVNFIHRLCLREIKKSEGNGFGKIRFISSPTPLGIHTHYDTIFENYENTINIVDEWGFAATIILGVIKTYAQKQKMNFIASPSYLGNDFFQFLLFPDQKLSFCISDESHLLPFNSKKEVAISRFFTDKSILTSEKVKTLLSIENSLLDKAVLSLYEGRNERFKYNNLTKDFSDIEKATECADKLLERLLN